jgi:hypothetical protein
MLESTVGQILVNDSLPEDLRDYSRVLDKSALSSLLKDVARKYPERYREISFELSQVGRRSAQEQGGFSFGARHLRKSKAAQAIQQKIKSELMGILSDESLTDQQRTDKIVRVVGRESSAQQKAVLEEAVKENNPLGLQVLSGSRGKPMNLASLLAADMLYSDHRDEVIPIPVLRSYSQGLTPAEYWAGTYGARRGIIATKFATQEAGFLCLAGDTMVRMADWSVKAIRDIKPGDMVIGSDKSGNTFPVKVSAKFENGKKELWRFRFRFGKSRKKFVEIVATKEHKALIEHLRRLRRRPATKLVIQTKTDVKPLGECERRSVSWHALLPVQSYTGGGKKEPLAWLIGWLIGEGGLTGHNTNVSGGDVVLIEEAKRRCKESGFSLDKRKNKDYEYTIHDDNPLPYEGNPGGGIAPNSFRCRLRKRLSELGLLQLKAHQKFIPDEVFSWDNESIAELIAWLIAGDGCVASIKNSTIPAIQLGLTADKVVRQVAELLMCRFGIYSQITVTPPQEKGNFPVSHLAINDRESVCRFLQYIGCATGAKQSLLLKLSEAIKPAFRRDKFLFHYFDKEYVGIEDTFDIEVDHPDHLFVLENGAIVSNSKQLNQAGHRLVVVDEDTDEVSPVTRGLIVDTEDMDNEGSLLAQDTGPFKRNTPLTPKILKQLKRLGKDRILVRSPLVGGSPEGGVYARDVGVREKGLLPGRGEQVGLQAAQALSEPISQGQLSAKHSGGVAGQEKAVGGFQYINQLIQTPKKMQGGAAHSTVDGMVQRVEPAPAGGSYVIINGEKHYVNAGYELKVKKGDEVEAGDLISDGIPNPAIITKYKGVGEGRRYFVREFKKAMASSGMFGHRRNIELLARGLINHVRLTEEVGEHVQDDIIPYSTLEHTYTPREGFQALAPKKAVGKYLERPVLHYTIGTKVRPSMLKDFDEFGVTAVDVHDNPPPFESHMVRGMYQLQHDPDWLTQMYGSGLKESLLESVARGGKSEQRGSSFVPSLATGTDFGDVPDRVVIKPQAPYALPNVKIPDLPDSLLSSPTPKMPEKLSASIMPPNV